MHDLAAIVKAYDIRGVVPDELDAEVARAVGRAAAVELGGPQIVVGRDMRPSSPELSGAFMAGVRAQGVDTVDVGLASTDLVYFASGRLGMPGAMFTASHNPPEYNGIKLCRAGAEPVSLDSGLAGIRDRARSGDLPRAESPGGHHERDMLADYAEHVRSFVDVGAMRELRVAVDAGNGMAGHVVPAVFEGLPLDVVPLYFELDGGFPNHPANPIEPENLRDLQEAVREHACAIGLAFDGDADRMFCVDEEGRRVPPSLVTAVIAETLLRRNPGATVLYNLITSRVVPETVEAAGGQAVRTRVGHSFIKARMKETGAVFAGEHSGHYYFRDNFRADSGLIAAVLLLEALGASGGWLSKVVAPYDRYAASGEINRRVDDQRGALRRVAEAFADQGRQDFADGLTHTGDGWWFNLRPSNTEPLLRLNVEADDTATMESVRDRVLALVQEA
ncbi:MAG: phosphomannomutase/phosphoglucomutase [Actinomycetota bacterium]|nr:phosphomannomutase/phosphoglucomutase [Actinomycetota bacterium]